MDETIYLDYLREIDKESPNACITKLKNTIKGLGHNVDEQTHFHYLDQLHSEGLIDLRPFTCSIKLKGKKRLISNKLYEESTSINHINYITHATNSIIGDNNKVGEFNPIVQSKTISKTSEIKEQSKISKNVIKGILYPVIVTLIVWAIKVVITKYHINIPMP